MSNEFSDLVADPPAAAAPAPAASVTPEELSAHVHALISAHASAASIKSYIAAHGYENTQGVDEAVAYRDNGGQGVNVVVNNQAANPGQPAPAPVAHDDFSDLIVTPQPEPSIGRSLGLGAREVLRGGAQMLGLIGDPANAAVNAALGTNLAPVSGSGDQLANAIGLPSEVTDGEKMRGAAISAGTSAMIPAAGAAGMVGRGIGGAAAEALAAQPMAQVVSGATSGTASEAVRQGGGGTAAQVAAGLAGGVGGFAGASAAGRGVARAAGAIERMTPSVAAEITDPAERLAAHYPPEALVDHNGGLSENGREIVERSGADPASVLAAYRAKNPPKPMFISANEAGREGQFPMRATGTTGMPVSRDVPTFRAEGAQANDNALAVVPSSADPVPIGNGGGGELPPADTPNARFAEADAAGVRLTRGQAEQNFGAQADENALRYGAPGESADRARAHFDGQRTAINNAAQDFVDAFKTGAANATERGQLVKDAISQLRDQGKAGINALYRHAEQLGGSGLPVETTAIRDAATDVLINEAVPELVKKSVGQELARYGLIGEAAPINEAGITKVKLEDGSLVAFRGPVKQLTVANSEELRQAVNRLYDSDPTRASQAIKPAIDAAVQDALEHAATHSEGGIAAAYSAARAANVTQRQAFGAKDIIQKLIDRKTGTTTAAVLPEKAIAAVLANGKEGVTNLNRVKGLLLASGNPETRQAWAAIKQQAVADLFDTATQSNVRIGGEIVPSISGAKLNSAIDKFGTDKLRVLLDGEDFNQLMRLRRVIGNATIPITGTVNSSGSAYAIMRFLSHGTLRLVPFGDKIGAVGGALIGKAREMAAVKKTLAGIEGYDGRGSTSARIDKQAQTFMRDYIAAGKSGALIPPTLTGLRPQDNQP